MAVNLTTQTVAPDALVDTPKVDMPDLSGASKEDLAKLLTQEQAGGTQAPAAPAPQEPPKPEEPPKEGVPQPPVPDKFRNKDGTINTDNLLKSYLEAEKKLSQSFQTQTQFEDLQKENQEIRQIANQMQAYIERMQSQPQQPPQIQPQTQEQIDFSDPQAVQKYLDSRIEQGINQRLQQHEQELDNQRVEDWKILQAVADARKNLDGFKELEPEINKILQAPWIDRNPECVKFGYFAALGQKTPTLLKEAQNRAFTEGYKKGKEELTKGVDSGRSSAPAEAGQFTPEQLVEMKKEELANLLPDYGHIGM